MENLRLHLVSKQVTVDRLQRDGTPLIIPHRVSAELNESLKMVTEQVAWLRHVRHLIDRELTLARGICKGEAGSVQGWMEREPLDKMGIKRRFDETAASCEGFEKLWTELAPITSALEEGNVIAMEAPDVSEEEWVLVGQDDILG